VRDGQAKPPKWLWRVPPEGSQQITSGNLGTLGKVAAEIGGKDANIAKVANISAGDSAGNVGEVF
jgi:hypothetical protein